MAPVTTTSIGVNTQRIEDVKLMKLLESLRRYKVDRSCRTHVSEVIAPVDIDGLVGELKQFPEWRFQEQADLHDWVVPLDAIDASISFILLKYPAVLLIAGHQKGSEHQSSKENSEAMVRQAESIEDIAAVPDAVVMNLRVLLMFLSRLLRNSINISIFNSLNEVCDLLAAADDEVASLAIEVICALATPPALHKQQSPEMHQQTSSLHTSKTNAHKRLLALSKGWGSRGSGLGLFACVTADDSIHGQGALPEHAGELNFEFLSSAATKLQSVAEESSSTSQVIRIRLSTKDFVADMSQIETSSPSTDQNLEAHEVSKQKRRKTNLPSNVRRGRPTKSTAEIFFHSLQQAGGRNGIVEDRAFALLADVRLAKAFHSQASRVKAVESRLRALIAVLHTHPSQDIMSGYFHAQPELCIELIDLLRPTVSSASVSAASAKPNYDREQENGQNLYGIAALAESPVVPYSVRTIAIETLTALVGRREATSGGLTGVARQSNVLSELGVAKGQYLGLLPTLIRYSLASLGSFLSRENSPVFSGQKTNEDNMELDDEDISLEIGLAFLEATKPSPIPQQVQLERALEFIDAALTLTLAVVSAPSGTAALTDCGIIPALLSTIASDAPIRSIDEVENGRSAESRAYSICLMRYITSQAIQIVEGAIVTHNNALAAFHDLQGVDILVSRFHTEIKDVRQNRDLLDQRSPSAKRDSTATNDQPISAPRRVLLFSILNCLTHVFHQESTSSSRSAPSAGVQLRKPELTESLRDIIENVSLYGGVLAAIACSILSDIMNSDPQVVHHVHRSGLASAFLKMVKGSDDSTENQVRQLPPVPELIVALPNVLSALSLTEDGARSVREDNPFPALLAVFRSPEYAMPKSRCLLNELTAIVGTGLDEIMRHENSMRPLVVSAVIESLRQIISEGQELLRLENSVEQKLQSKDSSKLESERTCLIQYVLNFGHIIEQLAHNEDHCGPFVDGGGLEAMIDLLPIVMSSNSHFLAHISCLSAPTVCTVTHSTVEEVLLLSIKSMAVHYDVRKMIKKITRSLNHHIDILEESEMELRAGIDRNGNLPSDTGVLQSVPRDPIYSLEQSSDLTLLTKNLSTYLRNVVALQWLVNALSGVLRAALQRSHETGTGWGRTEREWKNELTSSEFSEVVKRVSQLHRVSLLEACRIRTEPIFDELERKRLSKNTTRVIYKLRIVCQEGAVVRNGIEIDSSPNVGSMEMGEIVFADDRCVNSSGVLRYRTSRGWVSELTRGHGREPIAEVMGVWKDDGRELPRWQDSLETASLKRTECGVAGLASASAAILVRLNRACTDLLSSLSRISIQGFRSIGVRSLSFQEGTVEKHVSHVGQLITSNIEASLNLNSVTKVVNSSIAGTVTPSQSAVALYFAYLLSLIQACLFIEKRERRTVNVPLMILVSKADESEVAGVVSFFGSLRFILNYSLADFNVRSLSTSARNESKGPRQLVGKVVASSLPNVISLLSRLVSTASIANTPICDVMSRMNKRDLALFLGEPSFSVISALEANAEAVAFRPDNFVKALHCEIAEMVLESWVDRRALFFPAHIMHPFTTLARELVSRLEQSISSSKTKISASTASEAVQDGQWDIFSRSASATARRRSLFGRTDDSAGDGADAARRSRENDFEPSEEAISRLEEMGFDRDRALDAIERTQSNRLEIAMEYALSHPPPSPATIQRRRAAREERRRQQEEQEAGNVSEPQLQSRAAASDGTSDERGAPRDGVAESNEQSSDPMNVESTEKESRDKSLNEQKPTESEKKEDVLRMRERKCIQAWNEEAVAVSVKFLSGVAGNSDSVDDGRGIGDGESEALTVVVCSFLLDTCQRRPEKQSEIVHQLLNRLNEELKDDHEIRVREGKERSVCCLCHASVLFLRAFPTSRVKVLELGLVQKILRCIQSLLSNMMDSADSETPEGSENQIGNATKSVNWPMWLSPALLLIDVMAQPLVAFPGAAVNCSISECEGQTESELEQVRNEHVRQAALLAETAQMVFSTVSDQVRNSVPLKSDGNASLAAPSSTDLRDGKGKVKDEDYESQKLPSSPFVAVPPYFPLIPSDASALCMSVCLSLLGKPTSRSSTGRLSSPPPGVAHATLLLLSRLLRSPKLASQCLESGAAELILDLPRCSRFKGNLGLVTVILRRLLEDEVTLQASMETEIRGVLTKLHRKQTMRVPSSADERPSAQCHAFIQAARPLICRDPSTFLKAAACSLRLKHKGKSMSDGNSFVLLSADERARNVKALSSPSAQTGVQTGSSSFVESPKLKRRGKQTQAAKADAAKVTKGKNSNARRSSSKKSKKEKGSRGQPNKNVDLNGTPANHVTSLLISKLFELHQHPATQFGEEISFVWIADVLEILADLVLAIPACAAAIHRYRPYDSTGKVSKTHPVCNLRHALLGCSQPPKTVVSFLLHCLLPQDRWTYKNSQERKKPSGEISDQEFRSRKESHINNKVSQTSARLLISLVARAGEGRHRVLTELTYALSGSKLGGNPQSQSTPPAIEVVSGTSDGNELVAIQAWGELCTGLAAPRSNGTNHDSDSALSFEVVKLLFEYGIVHALLYSIQRVHLKRPMTASTCASLLVPLEIFTRGSVVDAVQKMSAKEAAGKPKVVKKKQSRSRQRSESSAFADDAMLEDGFDEETAVRTSRAPVPPLYDAVEHQEEYGIDAHGDNDIEMEDNDFDSSENDDETASSDEDSNETDTEEMVDSINSAEDDIIASEQEEDEEDGDDSDNDEDDEDNNDAMDVDAVDDTEVDWNEEYNSDFFEDPAESEMDHHGIGPPSESDMEDGWTRIESSGLGGTVVRHRTSVLPGNMSAQTRGFIDAAEAMIGTLLRTGEIQGDALAEIEDTLGIRITQQRGVPDLPDVERGQRATTSERRRSPQQRPGTQRSRERGIVGTFPQVQQRHPPEVGYSAFASGGRELNATEYVFGGPSISAGCRNYDILSPESPVQTEHYSSPLPTDTLLFPRGPAAATHARTRQSLHPLLDGLNLPPISSMVSDLLPHGVRATVHGQTNSRRTREWQNVSSGSGGYLVSANGSVIRINRGINASSTENSSSEDRGGLSGWTDDGLLDGNVNNFSDAFEQALGESLVGPSAAANGNVPGTSSEDTHQAVSDATAVLGVNNAIATSDEPDGNSETRPAYGATDASDTNAVQASNTSERPLESSESQNQTTMNQDGSNGNEGNSTTTSEGEGVASSLAAGLRLSPRSDSSVISGNVDPTDSNEITANSEWHQTNRTVLGHPSDSPSVAAENTAVASPESSPTDRDAEESAAATDTADGPVNASNNPLGETEESNPSDASQGATGNVPNASELVCPPGMDADVFNSLPSEMQQELLEQHRLATDLAAQSGLDAETLAALPEELRREAIEHEQQARRMREQPPADPSNAEDMDNANFVASLTPELREEILLTADEATLNSLPPHLVAEAHVLRERATARTRRMYEDDVVGRSSGRVSASRSNVRSTQQVAVAASGSSDQNNARRKRRTGKMRVEIERNQIVYLPSGRLGPPIATSDIKALVRLMYLLSPVRPQRLLQRVIQNLCATPTLRGIFSSAFVRMLNDDAFAAANTIDTLAQTYAESNDWRKQIDEDFSKSFADFPPSTLIGVPPEVQDLEALNPSPGMFRRRGQGNSAAASIAANLPTSARGSCHDRSLPPVVATRTIDTLSNLSKNSPKCALEILATDIVQLKESEENQPSLTCLDKLLDLFRKPLYSHSSSNLEQLLNLIEAVVSPLSLVPNDGDEDTSISKKEQELAASAGKEWVEVPRVAISQSRLQLLCSVLRMESCRDSSFVKVNTIARRLCRVKANRGCILAELASVAQTLASDAVRDLRALNVRMNDAVSLHHSNLASGEVSRSDELLSPTGVSLAGGRASSSVTLSTSSSELKLLRVLQTLHGLCTESSHDEHGAKKNETSTIVTEELVDLLHRMDLENLWKELTSCLKVVQILEGVASVNGKEEKKSKNDETRMETDEEGNQGNQSSSKKLQNSVAGLLTRFLPMIEAFFVANASVTRSLSTEKTAGNTGEQKTSRGGENDFAILQRKAHSDDETDLESLVDGKSLIEFVTSNKVLVNALIRNNPGLLEKGLRAMVQVPQCRCFLEFDVKRQWFKTQVRRLRQQASRRHGSLRLTIRRRNVFQDAYDQLGIRNADEMRGRLHLTFQNEEGVDAGGLSREFFEILAKEMFNPNYALFTSTEDGCTFQPNPNSKINPDHLSYFKFVGRIVGKALADGFLLDAHFTRSLYKQMLGLKPTYHDMEAIDPDYYKNLQTILDYNLADIGLDLTFSYEDHSFGRKDIIDLIPDGRRIAVTEETKAQYVSLVCQHRMTTAISNQIKAYLDGFYELVSPELISIFTPKELELLISGLPDIDVHDLRLNTDYNGYKATDKEIGWFWNVMFSLSRSEKAAFLQFVTGSSKVPLSGFAELQGMRGTQKFSIHKVGGSGGALMSAHTCFNSLDLPVYKSESETKEKLLYAISEGGGGFLFA